MAAAEPVPTPFGIHLMEPSTASKEAEEDRALADRHRDQCAAQSLRLSGAPINTRGDIMNEERDKVRCQQLRTRPME